MKKTRVLAIVLLSAALLSGCSKDSSNELRNAGNDITYTSNSNTYPVAINFKLTIQPSTPGSLIQWNNGYINANGIVFNGVRRSGNAVIQLRYGTLIAQKVCLPDTKLLGNVYAPALKYDHAGFTVSLDRNGLKHSLILNGMYFKHHDIGPPTVIPVQLIIDGPVDLNTAWLNDAPNGIVRYWDALIELSTDQLSSGIDVNMMNSATLTAGIILISNNTNISLYDIVIGNLQNNLMVAQLSPQDISTPNNPDQ